MTPSAFLFLGKCQRSRVIFCNNQYIAGKKIVPLPSSTTNANFFEAFYSAIALTESEVGWRSCNDERLCAFLLSLRSSYRAPAYLWRDLAWKLVVHIMSILAHDSSSLCSTHTENRSSIPFSRKKERGPHFLLYLFPNVGTSLIRALREGIPSGKWGHLALAVFANVSNAHKQSVMCVF